MVAFARVALNLPVAGEFTYLVPERLARELEPGCRVRVPFHGRRMAGIVVSLDRETDVAPNRLKEIDSRIAGIPALPPGLVEFTRELARAYACSWGTALEAALPGTLKRGPSRTLPAVELALDEGRIREACLELEDRAPKRARVLRVLLELGSPLQLGVLLRRTGLSRSPVATLVKSGHLRWTRVEMQDDLFRNLRLEVAPRHELVPAQRQAVESVVRCLHSGRHETFLLHGVTGSGKTEVYLRVLEELRSLGRSAIILVPEISLTPQTVGRFLSRFPDVAVLHSSLTDATRARQWLRIARGEAKVVAGARSALFAPCRELGLIIVDEEHESSFKQQQSPRYHAREMAVLRGRIENAAVVLGSATPSLEAWSRSRSGEYTLLRLPERVGGGSLPRVQIVDMRHEAPVRGKPPLISRRLEILMQEKARAGEQFMLFLNRRGYSPVLFCPACGETIKCAACEIPMTWHAQSGRLICHYCMADRRRPELCPGCEASAPIALGAGTERIEHWIKRSFPELVVARMDSDTMVKRDSYEKVLTAFRRRDIDVLVGTQMIAKGHDFPDVTLVGVIHAEGGLFLPDFRAGERCFQLLAQVSGRAGRGEKEGVVLVQTMCPDAQPIARAVEMDYEGFAAAELGARSALDYPPSGKLARVVFESRDRALAERRAREVAGQLRSEPGESGLAVLGPAPAPLARVRQRHRFHLVLKFPCHSDFDAFRGKLLALEGSRDRRLRILVDVDPYSML